MNKEYFLKVKEYLLELEYNIVSENEEDELFVVEKEDDGIVNLIIDCNADGKLLLFRDTLQLENLDLNELEGTLNSLALLLSEFAEKIIAYSKMS